MEREEEQEKKNTGGKMNQNVFKTTQRLRDIRADCRGGARFVKETGPTERPGHAVVCRRKATTRKTHRRLESVAPSVDGISCSTLVRPPE